MKTRHKIFFCAAVVRKKYIAVALTIVVLISAALSKGGADVITAIDAFAVPMSGKVVLIDPGHGGIDAGASANRAVEKDLNLKIAFILQKYIEESGGVAILTRTDDSNTANPERGRGVSQKSSDLKERKKDIDDYDADVFISIHMNKFGQAQYKGAQVFYTEKSEESKRLGEELQQAVKDVLNDGNKRRAKPSGSIFVLKGNTVPSALIECGFLSNAEEAALLSDENYQRRVAWGIYVGIVRFFSR